MTTYKRSPTVIILIFTFLLLNSACGKNTTDEPTEPNERKNLPADNNSPVVDDQTTVGDHPEISEGSTAAKPCHYGDLTPCVRGIYVSLDGVLGNAEKEEELLAYANKNNIKLFSYYGLEATLQNTAARSNLASLMKRARLLAIPYHEAISSTVLSYWGQIAEFHRNEEPFDGLLTEIEFWNGPETEVSSNFQNYLNTLAYLGALTLKRADGSPMPIKTYLGWFTGEQAIKLVPLVDEVYLHAYVKEADHSFEYTRSRVGFLLEAMLQVKKTITIKPIFSAEGPDRIAPGGQAFMGEWIRVTVDPLNTAEKIYLQKSEAAGLLPKFTGAQYFIYSILKFYYP